MSENKIYLKLLGLSLAPQPGVTQRYIAKNRANRLYGTTLYGGNTFASGAVFELQRVKGVWQENVIHSFGLVNDGFYPYGHLA